ncbi:uncharacterized protein LOC135398272 isoform X2 [Ornithodoros turicata]|uniref:uncharacterized protein LOC135398272 isoform X2 n=1 Tax=Ornithodoros turicata TaxID=34597 RepID=UPI0031391BE5
MQQTTATSGGSAGPKPPDSMKVMRSAIRALRIRLDRVGRKMTTLNDENQMLSNRLTSLRMENAKLHQALEKERTRLKNIVDGAPGTPANSDAVADIWLPSGGRASSLADGVTPSTSSASLDAILSTRRFLPSTSSPLPQVTTPRSATSFQDPLEDHLLLCTDLFDDGTSEDSLTTHAASKATLSADAVPSNGAARQLSEAVKLSLSTTTIGAPSTVGGSTAEEAQCVTLAQKDGEGSSPGSSGSCRPTERKRKKTSIETVQSVEERQQEGRATEGERMEPRYSMSSSSLD